MARAFVRLVVVGLLLLPQMTSGSAARQRTGSPPPARIVSLVPAGTEMLFAIGAGDRVAAVSSFDRFPPDVEKLPRVGALLDPDVERILSLRPDLVIAYHTQTDLLAQMKRAGIPVFAYTHGGLVDVTATIREIGRRAGAASAAAQLAGRIEARIGEIQARTKGRHRPRTLVLLGRDRLSLRGMLASGGTGFIHDMLTAAGGDNVLADVPRESLQVSTELILARRPEAIVELLAEPIDEATRQRELRVWDALSSVPAVRARRVRIIADPRVVIPGPRVADGIELLWRALEE